MWYKIKQNWEIFFLMDFCLHAIMECMGTYLNPNNDNFREFSVTGRYVDKTMLIDALNTYCIPDSEQKFVCVSRPRRFGKSIAGDVISAYYFKRC